MTELAELPVVPDIDNPDTRDGDTEVEHRLRVIRGDASDDDLMVTLGLIAAGRLPAPADEHRWDRAAVEAALEAAGEHRNRMYDLWYRMKIPFGEAALDSWYVLTLALGRTGGDLPAAISLYTTVLEELSSAGEVRTAQVFADRLGVPTPATTPAGATATTPATATATVVTRHPSDAQALTEATLRGTALGLGRRRPWWESMTERAVTAWSALRDEERPVLLLELQERITGLEQVRFFVDGQLLDNRGVGAMFAQCARAHPRDWTTGALALATLGWMWKEAGFCLQELNQSVICLPLVLDFAVRRLREYERRTGTAPVALPTSPIDLARALGGRRVRTEQDYLRCLQFDGGNWERREFLVPRAQCDTLLRLPGDLRDRLESAFDTTLSGEGPQVWEQAVEAALGSGHEPTDIIKLLARWTADDDALPVDYAICTVPLGVKLERPWELDYADVLCYTAFNAMFDPSTDNVPFDYVGISNAIGQRLRYNVVKKAQNYTLLRRFKAQSFNLPDIAVAEDANHAGHRAAGIRMSCRIPTYINYRGLAWKGLADVRLNRTHYSHQLEFRPSDVPLANRSATWLGWIADATYARDLLFDAKYGKKLTEREM